MGIIPAGAYGNRNWIDCGATVEGDVELALTDVMYDPQTSGGLLISVPEKEGLKLFQELKDSIPVSAIVGHVEYFHKKPIIIR